MAEIEVADWQRVIVVDEDAYDDLQVLKVLNGFTTDESMIQYLITCYGVYCHMMGLSAYEVLREHRKRRYGVKTNEDY